MDDVSMMAAAGPDCLARARALVPLLAVSAPSGEDRSGCL